MDNDSLPTDIEEIEQDNDNFKKVLEIMLKKQAKMDLYGKKGVVKSQKLVPKKWQTPIKRG